MTLATEPAGWPRPAGPMSHLQTPLPPTCSLLREQGPRQEARAVALQGEWAGQVPLGVWALPQDTLRPLRAISHC